MISTIVDPIHDLDKSRKEVIIQDRVVGNPLLKDIDYIGEVLRNESSFAEQAFAIFMNNLEVDEDGNVLNYKYCENRAAQYIRGR